MLQKAVLLLMITLSMRATANTHVGERGNSMVTFDRYDYVPTLEQVAYITRLQDNNIELHKWYTLPQGGGVRFQMHVRPSNFRGNVVSFINAQCNPGVKVDDNNLSDFIVNNSTVGSMPGSKYLVRNYYVLPNNTMTYEERRNFSAETKFLFYKGIPYLKVSDPACLNPIEVIEWERKKVIPKVIPIDTPKVPYVPPAIIPPAPPLTTTPQNCGCQPPPPVCFPEPQREVITPIEYPVYPVYVAPQPQPWYTRLWLGVTIVTTSTVAYVYNRVQQVSSGGPGGPGGSGTSGGPGGPGGSGTVGNPGGPNGNGTSGGPGGSNTTGHWEIRNGVMVWVP